MSTEPPSPPSPPQSQGASGTPPPGQGQGHGAGASQGSQSNWQGHSAEERHHWQQQKKPNPFARAWSHRGKIAFGVFLIYSGANVYYNYRQQKIRNTIHPNTILHWRITDGSIVETDTDKGNIQKIIKAAGGTSPTPVSTLIDIVTALKHARQDPRIVGIVANFSTGNSPAKTKGLGLAQIQELRTAIQEFKEVKAKALGGEDKVQLIAYTDSFDNQNQYYLASAFDKVYMQPTGSIPLVGLSSTVPFFKTLLGRFGILVRAEARKEYKSMVSPFTETELPPPQKQNLFDLLKGLNSQILSDIAKSRQKVLGSDPVEKLNHLIQIGPFMGSEAKEEGLVDGLVYKRDCGKMVEKNKALGIAHYMRVKATEHTDKLAHTGEPSLVVGLVYLIGGIKRGGGDFGANTIVKGIREAANDPSVDAVVLRIDSGGGDVVASDTIGDAIRWCQDEKKKPVVVSFGNTSASGGYFISTHAKAIVAQPTTVTGSIGVASLRPYFTPEFFKLIGVSVEQFFTGSSDTSVLNDLEGAALTRYKRQIDATYTDFIKRVADGRKMTLEQVEEVAGGRVMNGKEAIRVGLVDKLGGLDSAITLAGAYGLEAHKNAGQLPSDMEVKNVVVKVFPKPKPLLQQIVDSMTGDEAVDMYAKQTIRAVMTRIWSGDMVGLMQEIGLSESEYLPGSNQLEMEELGMQ
ncbi:protease IV [Entomortierella parvispora]|uniref:Protease IV n=1 Tax=Entomortierella parvispora TaxID=205924 RepID=A0A9P3H1D4_9FUNG|nr:protease IV [Entomortierella parvispora]